MMNKKILTSIIAMCIAFPAMANIASDTENPTCDNTTIGATSGDTNMEAIWDANTINIEWYSEDRKIAPINNTANTCTYDGQIVLPTNTLSKTGYTFDGWSVIPSCANGIINNSINGASYGRLRKNEWFVSFDYGTIRGVSILSSTPGTVRSYTGAVPSDEEGTYCWCKLKLFIPTNETKCAISNTLWVYNRPNVNESTCTTDCAAAFRINDQRFRTTLLGPLAQ